MGYDLWMMSGPGSRTEKRRLRLHRIGKGLGHPIERVQRLWKEWGPSLCSMVSQARHLPKLHSFLSEAEARPVGGRSCRLPFNFSANTGISRSLLKEIRDTFSGIIKGLIFPPLKGWNSLLFCLCSSLCSVYSFALTLFVL